MATQLGQALSEAGQQIVQVFSKTAEHAGELAAKLGCAYTTNIDEITENADIYIISVKDDAIATLAEKVGSKAQQAIIVHTAGSIAMEVLQPYAQHYGVLYPMQTFSKNKPVDFKPIPCFIEASDDATLSAIRTLADRHSAKNCTWQPCWPATLPTIATDWPKRCWKRSRWILSYFCRLSMKRHEK